MSSTTPPLIAAQEHAVKADDLTAQGLLIPAAEHHEKAAASYQECVDASSNESAKTTLRRLNQHHAKMAADLQTRIAQLRRDGIDPTLPQKPSLPRPASVPTHLAPGPSASPPPHATRPGARLGESHYIVDESFMVLGQQSADAGDAFNHFWKAMERLDHLAQPVAFATASLGLAEHPAPRAGRSLHSSESDDSDRPRKGGSTSPLKHVSRNNSGGLSPEHSFSTAYDGDLTKSRATKRQPVVDLRGDFDEIVEEDYDSSDSFCFVPSKSEPTPAVLKKENDALKSEAQRLQRQLENLQKMLQQRTEQDQQLRENIAVARREAQRAMGASLMVQTHRPNQPSFDLGALGSLNIPPPPTPPPPPPPARSAPNPIEAQQAKRIRELEEELRAVRVENEKQKAMIAKFRERWDKLKESAKRKREAKAQAEAQAAPVHERIDEEPEAEAQAEAQDAAAAAAAASVPAVEGVPVPASAPVPVSA